MNICVGARRICVCSVVETGRTSLHDVSGSVRCERGLSRIIASVDCMVL